MDFVKPNIIGKIILNFVKFLYCKNLKYDVYEKLYTLASINRTVPYLIENIESEPLKLDFRILAVLPAAVQRGEHGVRCGVFRGVCRGENPFREAGVCKGDLPLQ